MRTFEQHGGIGQKIATALNDDNQKVQERVNGKRKAKTPYEDGIWVWLLNPKKVGGNKIERWWRGPFKVVQRVGEASYQIRTDRCVLYDVHRDQLKPCLWDVELGESYPLVFRASDPADQRTSAPVVDRIMDHRSHPLHGLEFLAHWTGREQDLMTWEPAGSFLHGCPDAWLSYCHEKGLVLDLHQVVGSVSMAPDISLDPQDE